MVGSFFSSNGVGLLHAYVATSDYRAGEWKAIYSIAPRTKAPVVREFVDDDGVVQRRLELARWGSHPSWAKDRGPRPINARMETSATNGMFRGPFSSGRAVVPMTSYYEWVEAEDGGKDPYVIHHPDGKLLHAAGLTAARKADDGESWDITFTIVTREARDAGGEVHDRMPVFLTDSGSSPDHDCTEAWSTVSATRRSEQYECELRCARFA